MQAGALGLRSIKGQEGKIIVPGLGAVVGTFSSWHLRREENGRAGPRWSLHAVFSYQNEVLMKNEAMKKKIILVLSKDQKIELCGFESIRIEGASLILEGVVQCQ